MELTRATSTVLLQELKIYFYKALISQPEKEIIKNNLIEYLNRSIKK